MLNSNIPLDFKEESGKPFWKVRGADTWNPFKSVSSYDVFQYTATPGIQGGSDYVIAYTAETECKIVFNCNTSTWNNASNATTILYLKDKSGNIKSTLSTVNNTKTPYTYENTLILDKGDYIHAFLQYHGSKEYKYITLYVTISGIYEI